MGARGHRIAVIAFVVVSSAACGRVAFTPYGDGSTDGPADGVSGDGSGVCGPWAAPILVPGLEGLLGVSGPTLLADQRTMYFDDRSSIFVATRTTSTDPFGAATAVTGVGGGNDAEISGDGTELFCASDLTAGRITTAARSTNERTFINPLPLNSLGAARNAAFSTTTRTLRYDNITTGNVDRAVFDGGAQQWVVVSAATEIRPASAVSLTADELTVVFERMGATSYTLYIATRANVSLPFGTPTEITELIGVPGNEPWIAPDGRTLYFASTAPEQLYMTSRSCP